jgi:phage tail sheath protein FI
MQSPGVQFNVIDASAYLPASAIGVVGMVGTASKGPMETRTLITDEGTLIATFGPPISGGTTHYGLLAAIQYLRWGRALWYVRVGTYAEYAQKTLFFGISDVVTLRALTRGTWGNSISIVVSSGYVSGTKKIVVKYSGTVVETYDNLKMTPSSDINYYVTRMSGSAYVACLYPSTSSGLDNGTYTLTGGDDGATATKEEVIGTRVDQTYTGLQLFRDPLQVEVDMLACPGRSEREIVLAGFTVAEDRGDCIYLPDAPDELTRDDVVDWHNGTYTGGTNPPLSPLSTSFGALYYPWAQVYDGYSNTDVWVPPSGIAAGIMAYSQEVSYL